MNHVLLPRASSTGIEKSTCNKFNKVDMNRIAKRGKSVRLSQGKRMGIGEALKPKAFDARQEAALWTDDWNLSRRHRYQCRRTTEALGS